MRIYTIHKEILKEIAFTFFLSLVSLNFILMMEKVLKLSRLLSVVGASLFDMIRIILYLQPPLLIITLPMSLLMSTLLTYGRLNADNELTILKASGMPFKTMAKPIFIAGTACFLAGLLVSFYLGPKSMVQLRETISGVLTQRAPAAIEEGVFTTLFRDTVLFVKEKTDAGGMKEIFIYDERNKKEPKVLVAKEGRIYVAEGLNIAFYLKDGFMHIAKGSTSTEIFFDGYNLTLSLAADRFSRKKSELTPMELLEEAENKPREEAISMYLEFHRRLSLPSVSLLLMLLGLPLSLVAGKSGRLGGLTMGLLIFVAFYMFLIYGENLARTEKVAHYVGAWSPTFMLSILAIWMFGRESGK